VQHQTITSKQTQSVESSHPIISSVYSKAEEFANSTSHGIGVIFGIIGLVMMLLIAGSEASRIASAIIYGVSIIMLFSTSTIYHSVTHHSTRALMKTLDHCAIYLLIAGTYTPFMLISLENSGGHYYLTAIWIIALLGVLFKIFLGHRYPKTSLASYLAMGWFILIAGKELLANVSSEGLTLLAAGGICYTVGAIFYAWKKLVFNHAIWHLFVLGGAAFHFFSIYWYVLPRPVVS
jgi:hemolysin III